nr:hypothetical protein [Hyphobacterium sp. CCMP332]
MAPTPAGLTIRVNLDSPNLNATLRNLMTNDAGSNNGDGTATIRISRRFEELGPRNNLRETNSFQMVLGARGDLSPNWSYDIAGNYSRSSVANFQTGNLSSSAFQAGILCDGGPTALASGCTAPTVNIFGGAGSISAAGAAFISRRAAIVSNIETFQAVATVAGRLEALTIPMAETALRWFWVWNIVKLKLRPTLTRFSDRTFAVSTSLCLLAVWLMYPSSSWKRKCRSLKTVPAWKALL